MADIFWAYWDVSVRFGLLALLLLVLTPLLKRLIGPRLLCWAWAALILRLVLPISLPFSGSIFNAHEVLRPSAWTEAIRKGVVNTGLGETVLPIFRDQDEKILETQVSLSWETLMMALWLSGLAAMSLRLGSHVFQLHRFFSKAQKCEDGSLYRNFKDVIRRYGVYANVPLMISDEVKSPGIAGVFNPRVILPRNCVDKLSSRELKCVFMHELVHYRRGDLFLHHALLLVCYLHWYNPVVWLALRQFAKEMEKACDAEVVDSFCSNSAKEYGYTLIKVLNLAKEGVREPIGALALLGSRNSGSLRERIELIARPRGKHPFLTGVGLSIFAGSLFSALTGEVNSRADSERLVRLTRLAAPFGEEGVIDLKALGYEGTIAREIPFSEDQTEWVQIVEASKFAEMRLRITAKIQVLDGTGSFDLWSNLDDFQSRTISSRSSRIEGSSDEMEISIEVYVPDAASKLSFGVRSLGGITANLESLDIDIIDNGRSK